MMRFLPYCFALMVSSCVLKGTNPDDPYEPMNRRVHQFNQVFDSALLKPSAKVYQAVVPDFVRAGVNNVYNNIGLLPTVANDVLQGEKRLVMQDTWRLIINSSIGVAGLFDPASTMGLPPHHNDLGLTFAKWGDRHSPYLVIPLLGPSTLRDGMGLLFDYTLFSIYPYLESNYWTNGLLLLRYVDLRSQLLDTDRLVAEAIDPYSFVRDAYLQHRAYLINGDQAEAGTLYLEEGLDDN